MAYSRLHKSPPENLLDQTQKEISDIVSHRDQCTTLDKELRLNEKGILNGRESFKNLNYDYILQ